MALIDGKIEYYQCKCNELKFVDLSTYDVEEPAEESVGEIVITIKKDTTTKTVIFDEYTNEEIILSKDTFNTDTYSDGEYTITAIYKDLEGETVFTNKQKLFFKCNITCKIDKLIADIAADSCSECAKDKIEVASNALLKLELLCYSLGCGDFKLAKDILNWLEEFLINYNCKNC